MEDNPGMTVQELIDALSALDEEHKKGFVNLLLEYHVGPIYRILTIEEVKPDYTMKYDKEEGVTVYLSVVEKEEKEWYARPVSEGPPVQPDR